jgi:hypothetical protein
MSTGRSLRAPRLSLFVRPRVVVITIAVEERL